MIDRHWDGIAAYCRPENKVALGFVAAGVVTVISYLQVLKSPTRVHADPK
jgi:hypothetical protein